MIILHYSLIFIYLIILSVIFIGNKEIGPHIETLLICSIIILVGAQAYLMFFRESSTRRFMYIIFGFAILIIFLGLILLNANIYYLLSILTILFLIACIDVTQKDHTIRRNFPVLGNVRFLLEFFRPEIQQYFIADDLSERPFNRRTRSIIYQRAKQVRDTVPFGTKLNIYQKDYEAVTHSLAPKPRLKKEHSITIGKTHCSQPYCASHLNISAMSFGALSKNAILALNHGAKKGNFYHNTGEGGLSHYHLEPGGDIVWQIGTGYFGCRTKDGNFDEELFTQKASHSSVKMIEIKLSQGAKPAHGGILPAIKNTEEIAKIRHVTPNTIVISPPAHTAFNSPLELMQFVAKLRKLTNGKPIGFKLCVGKYSEFLSICKAMLELDMTPDFITVDGSEGGTGAAPLEFSDHIGIPLNEALDFVHSALMGCNLRDKITLIASGKVSTGFDMVTKLALGANICNVARSFMMALGCVQSISCNTNECPTGVATQNIRLMRGLYVPNKADRVYQFHRSTIYSFLEILAAMGLTNSAEIASHMVFRRDNTGTFQSYDTLYPDVEEGAFLQGKVPKIYEQYWNHASSQKF